MDDEAPEDATSSDSAPSGFAPFEPAYLASDLFHGLSDDEHPASWIARWLHVLFPLDGTQKPWRRRLRQIPEHAEDLVRVVIERICAAETDGSELAELIAMAADLTLPSKAEGRPRAPEAVVRLSNTWREELPQAINAWRWDDDAFAGFVPVLDALLALPFHTEPMKEGLADGAWPELLVEIAEGVTRYTADRRERVVENWPEGLERPSHMLSDKYPGGEMDYLFVDPSPEELAVRAPIFTMAKRFTLLVATEHGLVCPLPRDLIVGLANDLRQLDACPADVGWLMTLADQMVPDWSFNWLGDTTDWPGLERLRHPATVRAEQISTVIEEIRTLGLDALADALTVWLLGTQVLFWEGDVGLLPAQLKTLLATIATRETGMRAALARVELASREAGVRGSAYGAFYARLLESLIPAPKRPTLVMLNDYHR